MNIFIGKKKNIIYNPTNRLIAGIQGWQKIQIQDKNIKYIYIYIWIYYNNSH